MTVTTHSVGVLPEIRTDDHSMEDWIKINAISPHYPDHAPLSEYKIIKSTRWYETYQIKYGRFGAKENVTVLDDRIVKVYNETIRTHADNLVGARDRFRQAISARMIVAATKKLEGYELNEGQLIIQDRCKIQTHNDKGRYSITWYGKIDKIIPGAIRKVEKPNILLDMGFIYNWEVNCYIKNNKYITAQLVAGSSEEELREIALNDDEFCFVGKLSDRCINEIKAKVKAKDSVG
jgi:hypothetical protein